MAHSVYCTGPFLSVCGLYAAAWLSQQQPLRMQQAHTDLGKFPLRQVSIPGQLEIFVPPAI